MFGSLLKHVPETALVSHSQYEFHVSKTTTSVCYCTRVYQKVSGLALWRANRWQHRVARAAIVTFSLDKAVCQETSL
jgi:hypothetical protein